MEKHTILNSRPRRNDHRVFLLSVVLFLSLAACGDQAKETPAVPPTAPAVPTATPLPEITIVEREQLIIGVDSAFPPLVDLNSDGELVGLEVDLFATLAMTAGLEYQFVSADWDTIFLELVAGRFDAVLGGVQAAESPAELVDLTEPCFEVGQVAVVLNENQDIAKLSDLSHAVVGVQPLSWGEFAISGEEAFFPLPADQIRHFNTPEQLIDALFANYVDAIVTHHTVIESYASVNPGYMRVIPAARGGEGRDGWLTERSYHIAVPKGADELLATLNGAIHQLEAGGRIGELAHTWGFAPIFPERPKYVRDPSAASLIAGLEKVDNMTVRFILNRPDPFFEYKMTVPALAIHSPANLEKYDGGGELAQNPVGTGPYSLAGWAPGQALTLTANLDYWGAPPLVPTIHIQPIPDPAIRYTLLKTRRVQLVENLNAEDLSELDEAEWSDIAVYHRVPVNTAYLGMNRDLAPFDRRDVRLAIATCIDRPDLVETVYPTGTLIATQFVPPNTFGFTPGLLWHEQNAQGAADLLAGAGYSHGLAVTLSLADVPSDYLPEPRRIAEALQLQLTGCKITAELELLGADTFAQRLAAGELDFYLSGWSADFPGPINFLNTHFAAGRQFGVPFPEIVELLQGAAGSTGLELRRDMYNQVNSLLKEKVIFVPLTHGGATLAARDDLPGVVTNPVRRESLAHVGPITTTAAVTAFAYAVGSEPLSLDPSDEMDDATFAITTQIFDTLVDFEPATAVLTTGLAIEWSANQTADVWDFTLRPGVRFSDGAALDADAVLLNFERLWDPEHPLHVGRSGAFRYFQLLLGGFHEP